MVSIIFVAICVVIVTALVVSAGIHILASNDSGLSPLEKDCQKIADEGYKIHAIYPDSSPEDLPADDFKRIMELDKKWITQCVNVLPIESVFEIANNVQRDTLHGE